MIPKGSTKSSAIWLMWLVHLVTGFSKTEDYNQNRSQLQAVHQRSFNDLADVDECPVERYHNIKTSPEKPHYKTGEHVTLECKEQEFLQNLKLSIAGNYILEDLNLIVYPNNNRICQRDGTWSSKPPICSWFPAGNNFSTIDFARIPEIRSCRVNEDRCEVGELNEWIPVGGAECVTEAADPLQKVDTIQVVYTFARHVHLSFVQVPLLENIVGVTLKVKHRDLVRTSEMSLESPLLLERHYAAYKEKNKVAPHCTFTEVSAYSRKVMIEYSVNRDQGRGHMMQPEFFAVPDPGNARREAFHGVDCPPSPIIPHASLAAVIPKGREHNKQLEYSCYTDYQTLNPASKNITLECYRNFEWEPYPFLVCRKMNKFTENLLSASALNGNEIPNTSRKKNFTIAPTLTTVTAPTHKEDFPTSKGMQGNGVSSNYHKSHSSTKLKTYPIYSKSNFNERQIEDNHVNLESEYNHHETPTEETKQSTPELIDDSQSNSGLDDDDDDGTSKKTWGYNIWAIISVLSVTAGVIIAVTPIALCWYKLRRKKKRHETHTAGKEQEPPMCVNQTLVTLESDVNKLGDSSSPDAVDPSTSLLPSEVRLPTAPVPHSTGTIPEWDQQQSDPFGND